MGWREKMGGALAIAKTETLEQKPQKEQKGADQGASATIATIATKVEKIKNHFIPADEKDFARVEREAIVDADGGVESMPVEYPVEVKMESAILGATVDVMLWPDRAEVDGTIYTNKELTELKSRGLSAADLQTIHEAKKQFDGEIP
jgi:hypothetical protein